MEKFKEKIEIFIDDELCKGCDICVELCRPDVFIKSDKINSRGYYVPIPASMNKCTGCMICELICPELAVIIVKTESVKESV
ncbi:MAG: 4Fe-4S binding protein [Bacteroidetes bacterium]|nr:4Fe-4S binding protein [Bacteroidota bacterium]